MSQTGPGSHVIVTNAGMGGVASEETLRSLVAAVSGMSGGNKKVLDSVSELARKKAVEIEKARKDHAKAADELEKSIYKFKNKS